MWPNVASSLHTRVWVQSGAPSQHWCNPGQCPALFWPVRGTAVLLVEPGLTRPQSTLPLVVSTLDMPLALAWGVCSGVLWCRLGLSLCTVRREWTLSRARHDTGRRGRDLVLSLPTPIQTRALGSHRNSPSRGSWCLPPGAAVLAPTPPAWPHYPLLLHFPESKTHRPGLGRVPVAPGFRLQCPGLSRGSATPPYCPVQAPGTRGTVE